MRKKQADHPGHILYLGDWAFRAGPVVVNTPFGTEAKSSELVFHGSRLVESIEDRFDVTCMANWELYRLEPCRLEAIMKRSAGLIISDVEAKSFHLYPGFFERSRREARVVTYPDRLTAVREWTKAGGGLLMLGGWLSFSGVQGKAGWGRSQLAEALPVSCLATEDLVESSAGFEVEVVQPGHPVVKGLPWKTFPPLLGYNEVNPRAEGEVLVRVKKTGHPLLAVGQYGRGRVLTYMSDPAPHWGLNFEMWEGYARFWRQALDWATTKDPVSLGGNPLA
jgi:uncharacterized membrane protein